MYKVDVEIILELNRSNSSPKTNLLDMIAQTLLKVI